MNQDQITEVGNQLHAIYCRYLDERAYEPFSAYEAAMKRIVASIPGATWQGCGKKPFRFGFEINRITRSFSATSRAVTMQVFDLDKMAKRDELRRAANKAT